MDYTARSKDPPAARNLLNEFFLKGFREVLSHLCSIANAGENDVQLASEETKCLATTPKVRETPNEPQPQPQPLFP